MKRDYWQGFYIKYIQNEDKMMIKKLVSGIMEIYGSVENEKNLKKQYLLISLILCFAFIFSPYTMFPMLVRYFKFILITMVINIVSLYFFIKKKNANKYKNIKVIFFSEHY